MRKITLLTFLISLFCLTSCYEKDGDWKDTIKLSTKTVDFNAKGGEFTVTSKGEFWLLGTSIPYKSNLDRKVPSINFTTVPYDITGEWYSVNRVEDKTLIIHVDDNNTGIKRTFCIELEICDYFNRITVSQAEK